MPGLSVKAPPEPVVGNRSRVDFYEVRQQRASCFRAMQITVALVKVGSVASLEYSVTNFESVTHQAEARLAESVSSIEHQAPGATQASISLEVGRQSAEIDLGKQAVHLLVDFP